MYLFVYGTLLQNDNQFGRYLTQHCNFIITGKIAGILYDIGEYPGLVIDKNAGYVFGSVYQIHNTHVLSEIDSYEGVGAIEEQPNLYLRINHPIETAEGIIEAWLYVYNLPVDGRPQIVSGDYMEYLRQKKSPGN
ncbi:gamma-glutamylcyclotransferase [Mucilaginibacter sp. ZT4R22]|uniref:Gamma-glutamylcyclotransferase n=1 Tax=Mucilaginibacter pankratovii TaxID=2772110 RepID=A0ABR7WQM4_9SPHI|nr:gamma-glutamylcyclotransferase family protein [Mucilaginibacter pankratovii]MBD1364620.1 gamma-glutamylcyclotransferase [Mucilaginibacter pankratovii]